MKPCNTPPSGLAIVSLSQFDTTPPYRDTRNPVTHRGRGFRAKFASRKNGRMIRCESLLEMYSLFLFEFAREVVSFDEQPVKIWHKVGHRRRRYTPDICVKWHDGSRWYVEVKPAELLADEASQEKFSSIEAYFAARGDTFITLTEKQIYQEARLEQVRALLRARAKTAPSSLAAVLREISPRLPLTVRQAETIVGSREAVYALLAMRYLACDLTRLMTDDTELSTFSLGDDHALFV